VLALSLPAPLTGPTVDGVRRENAGTRVVAKVAEIVLRTPAEVPQIPVDPKERTLADIQFTLDHLSQNKTAKTVSDPIQSHKCLALPASRCTLVSFWGSGKAGSTTMAMRLKHHAEILLHEMYDPHSGFVDGGKEICWGLISSSEKSLPQFWNRSFPGCLNSTNPNNFALDACPRYINQTHAARLACGNPNMKFLWMVRDPIERTISEVNDPLSVNKGILQTLGFGKKPNITQAVVDKYIVNNVIVEKARYDVWLDGFLTSFPGSQMMIIVSEFQMFETVEEAQISLDGISDWLGTPRRKAFLLQANKGEGGRKGANKYIRPSAAAVALSRQMFHNSVEFFFEKIGRRIPWPNFFDTNHTR